MTEITDIIANARAAAERQVRPPEQLSLTEKEISASVGGVGTSEAYVVVYADGRFCRFGSYRKVDFTTNPLGATLYMRHVDAKKRIHDHWHQDKRVSGKKLRVVKLKAVWEVRK